MTTPTLVVVSGGTPTAEELAAVIVALSSRSRPAPPERATASAWADRSRLLRRPLRHGADLWRRGG